MEAADTSSNLPDSGWHHRLLGPWESLSDKEQRELKSKFLGLLFDEHASQGGLAAESSASPCRARIRRLLHPDYAVLGLSSQLYICGLAEIEEGPLQGRLAAFHASEVALFGHAGDFVDLVRTGDEIVAPSVTPLTPGLADLNLLFLRTPLVIGGDSSAGGIDGDGARLMSWLQERDLQFVDFVNRLSSDKKKTSCPPSATKLSGMISLVRPEDLEIRITSEGPYLGETAVCHKKQLFACGLPLGNVVDLKRVVRTGESIDAKVASVAGELRAVLAHVGSETPDGLEAWLAKKKMKLSDFKAAFGAKEVKPTFQERVSCVKTTEDPRFVSLLRTQEDCRDALDLIKVLGAAILSQNRGKSLADPDQVIGHIKKLEKCEAAVRTSDEELDVKRHKADKSRVASQVIANPLHLLRECVQTGERVTVDGDNLRFTSGHVMSKLTPTTFEVDSQLGEREFYTLGTLHYFLENRHREHADYLRAALDDNMSTVRKADRERVCEYFTSSKKKRKDRRELERNKDETKPVVKKSSSKGRKRSSATERRTSSMEKPKATSREEEEAEDDRKTSTLRLKALASKLLSKSKPSPWAAESKSSAQPPTMASNLQTTTQPNPACFSVPSSSSQESLPENEEAFRRYLRTISSPATDVGSDQQWPSSSGQVYREPFGWNK